MKRYILVAAPAALALGFAACKQAKPAPLYEKIAVARRDIVLSASAAGSIQPILTVDVKSKASGEIIAMPVETGDDVRPGQLLAKIDPRIPRANLEQAVAALEVAQAQLANARAQLGRSDTLFKTQAITETEYESARLAYAQANAQVVNAKTNLQSAKDAMEDTQVRAPLKGTVIQKNVELGTVISSPTKDVGGGTVLLRMANLDTVRVQALVDETDVGKVQPGVPVTITVDAYRNRPFEGRVLKIEPQAQVNQNVTMFPVLVNILNPEHLLKPGMNADVEIHVGRSEGVLAIPNGALRTPRDVGSAARVLGLDPEQVQQQLAVPPGPSADAAVRAGDDTGATVGGGKTLHAAEQPPGATFTTRDGRTIALAAGVTTEQVRAAFAKRRSGGELTPAEQALLAQVQGQSQRASGRAAGSRASAGPSGSYIVFTLRGGKPVPVAIQTGLTDQDFIEVTSGLTDQDTVLVLPSASLVQAQQDMQRRFQNVTGGGLPGLRQQQSPATPR
ncbi:MAG TPA: efflux RND transporter periplasmic adaptor subunit [Gemmatimonadales bacterium]|nr:efflux RND transporter periplasmic adaptor subunit [Gemmatimonadales bacterium]